MQNSTMLLSSFVLSGQVVLSMGPFLLHSHIYGSLVGVTLS